MFNQKRHLVLLASLLILVVVLYVVVKSRKNNTSVEMKVGQEWTCYFDDTPEQKPITVEILEIQGDWCFVQRQDNPFPWHEKIIHLQKNWELTKDVPEVDSLEIDPLNGNIRDFDDTELLWENEVTIEAEYIKQFVVIYNGERKTFTLAEFLERLEFNQ